jgi:hypothetical protein
LIAEQGDELAAGDAAGDFARVDGGANAATALTAIVRNALLYRASLRDPQAPLHGPDDAIHERPERLADVKIRVRAEAIGVRDRHRSKVLQLNQPDFLRGAE